MGTRHFVDFRRLVRVRVEMQRGETVAKGASDGGGWERFTRSVSVHCDLWMLGVLGVVLVFGLLTLDFFPTFAYPHGDEATYVSYARHPWTNVSEFFEGFEPKEMQNPYNFRLFIAPMSLVTSIFGFTSYGTRLVQLVWGLLLLWMGYRIGKRMGSPVHAMCAMAVLAWSPFFLYFTHSIRPEGMFTMWLLLTTWAMLEPEAPTPRTWAVVGFLASCHLWIHYNGVAMPIVFFLCLLWYDRRALSWKKVLAYTGGGVAFLALFVPLNILPAMETIEKFGIMPVTFSSSSTMPVTSTLDPVELFGFCWDYYRGYFGLNEERWWIDPGNTGGFTFLLLPAALWAVVGKKARRERGLLVVALLLLLALMTVIPNRRQEYTWYLVPFLFILGARGLGRLPAVVRTATAAIGLGIIALAFIAAAADDVDRFQRQSVRNVECARALAAVVEEGGGDGALVMGPQEFRIAVPDCRYRTLHSMLETRSFERALVDFEPDVVVENDRLDILVASYLIHWKKRADSMPEFIARVRTYMEIELDRAGYVRSRGIPYRWNDEDVTLWVKER